MNLLPFDCNGYDEMVVVAGFLLQLYTTKLLYMEDGIMIEGGLC